MPAIVGLLTLEISVPGSVTLKDKRSVVKSLADRLGNKFNVSVAQTGRLDSVRRATLSIAHVSNDHDRVQQVLEKVGHMAERERDAIIESISTEIW